MYFNMYVLTLVTQFQFHIIITGFLLQLRIFYATNSHAEHIHALLSSYNIITDLWFLLLTTR